MFLGIHVSRCFQLSDNLHVMENTSCYSFCYIKNTIKNDPAEPRDRERRVMDKQITSKEEQKELGKGVCVCVVSKCSTCHSSFRGFICGSKGTWLSWLCCGDGRYLCVHALQMCQQVSTSGKRYDIVSLREVHKTFTAISSSFYVLFSSITTQQMQHTNMVGAVGQKGIDGIEQGRRYSMFASASYLPPVNAPHDDSPRALKLQSYSWEVKIFWMSAFTISRLFFFLC